MESIWTKTCSIEERPSLSGNIKTEVAIIGAGLCGILCAYQLAAAGKRVVILEADRIAGGQTRGTTAKITSQHGLLYSDLLKQVGQAKAAQYAHVNESAVTEYRRMISTRQIDCDFEEMDAYVYSNDCTKLKEEADIASFLGLPASFAHPSTLPFPVGGAVRFDHQAQFHPLKFIKAISEKLRIFEHTLVTKVEGNLLYTDHGFVEAEKIIFACHYPFINFPGMYFARMHQERSYVIALEGASLLDGMYIGDGNQHFLSEIMAAFSYLAVRDTAPEKTDTDTAMTLCEKRHMNSFRAAAKSHTGLHRTGLQSIIFHTSGHFLRRHQTGMSRQVSRNGE